MSVTSPRINEPTPKLTYGIPDYEKIKDHIILKDISNPPMDSYEKSEQVKEAAYECYHNYLLSKGLPKSVFGDSFGYEMEDNIWNCMLNFYSGKSSQEDVENFFYECCTSMRIYRTQQYQTTGTNPDDNKKIVSEIYEKFTKASARAAVFVNEIEGKAIKQKTYSGRKNDWAYYNSDFYYQCEDMRETLQELTAKMTEKWNIPPIDTAEVIKNSILTVDGGFDFNSLWNFTYRNQAGMASIEDESMAPPRNFKLFFKRCVDPDTPMIGRISVSLGNREYQIDVPFVMRNSTYKGQIYYPGDLLKPFQQSKKDDSLSHPFLKNITVFAGTYPYSTGLIDIFGRYVSQKN